MRTIADVLPEQLVGWLKVARGLPYHGKRRRCPVCGWSSNRFRAAGRERRPDAQCAFCSALERHRLVWVFLQRKTDLFDGRDKVVLHVAPERCLESRLRERLGKSYLTADLHSPHAMVKMDITDIRYPDESFDVIYCSHVLEHVQDDRRAMRELHRVLRRTGWAILLVPIKAEKTFEDPTITDPKERIAVFGQADHVRNYGPDYVDRLRDAGFAVSVTTAADLLDRNTATLMGLSAGGGEIFYCTKA